MKELKAKNSFLRFAGYKTSKNVFFGPLASSTLKDEKS